MTATAYIQGEIRPIAGFSNSQSLMQFFAENSGADDYEVIINSYGGSVIEGWAQHDIIQEMRNLKPVKTIGYTVMSIATKPFLAGSERLVSKNVNFLIHNPYVPPRSVGGEAEDLERIAASLRKSQERSLKKYMEFSNVPEEEMREMMRNETELSAERLVEIGFATGILDSGEELQLQKYEKAITIFDQKEEKNDSMENVEKRLSVIEQFLQKFSKTDAKELQIALDDGRTVEVVTEKDKAMEGDSIKFEGKALEDGVYNTAETQEAYTVEAGKITAIEDISEEVFNAEEVQEFVMKAGEKTVEVINKKFEAYAKAEEFIAFQKAQNEEVEALKKELSEATSSFQKAQDDFQAALKEIKENLVSEFNLEEKNPNNIPEIQKKAWEIEMEKIRQKTNQ